MLPRWLQLAAGRTLTVFYAAVMLLGQGLHQWSCCDDDHGQPRHAAACEVEAAIADVGSASNASCASILPAGHAAHDSASCAICQFHHQGQLSQPAFDVLVSQFCHLLTPVHRPSPLLARLLRVHAPRAPPAALVA